MVSSGLPDRDVVVFTKNTTEAINRFARTMTLAEDAVVLTTVLEHHSNLLPWRRRGQVVHIRATVDGEIDENDLDAAAGRPCRTCRPPSGHRCLERDGHRAGDP